MKKFTTEEVAARKLSFTAAGFSVARVTLDGVECDYFVIPQSRNPQLPDFAVCISDGHDGVYGVSDSVPECFRPYWVAHEYLESRHMHEDGICGRVLEQELTLVPQDIFRAYISRRALFFKNLAAYAKANGYSQTDVDQYEKNVQNLEARLRG